MFKRGVHWIHPIRMVCHAALLCRVPLRSAWMAWVGNRTVEKKAGPAPAALTVRAALSKRRCSDRCNNQRRLCLGVIINLLAWRGSDAQDKNYKKTREKEIDGTCLFGLVATPSLVPHRFKPTAMIS